MLRAAARPADMVSVLAGSGAASAAVTGTTNETTSATVTIPAGTMRANSALRITLITSQTNNANAKTLRVKLGASTLYSTSVASSASFQGMVVIRNRNSLSSQACFTGQTGAGISGSAITTGAVDFSADVSLTITLQLGTGTDSFTLEGYLVEVLP